MPRSIQKYFLHPMTALLLAFGTMRFVARYHLIEFPYAALVSFVVVFASFLLFSRKYDLILSFLFFTVALFVGYKGAFLPPKPQDPGVTVDATRLEQKLSIAASLIKAHHLKHGQWPEALDELSHFDQIKTEEIKITYCTQNCQDLLLNLKSSADVTKSRFVLIAQSKDMVRAIDDQFRIYKMNQTGDNPEIIK